MQQRVFRLRHPESGPSSDIIKTSVPQAAHPEVIGYAVRVLVTRKCCDLVTHVKDWEIEFAECPYGEFHFYSPASKYVAKSEHLNGLLTNMSSNGLDKPFLQFYTGDQFELVPTIWKYAIRISSTEYTEFMANLKRFGFSSRSVKKVGEWLWISDSSIIAPVKLFCDANVIDLKALNDDYYEILKKYS